MSQKEKDPSIPEIAQVSVPYEALEASRKFADALDILMAAIEHRAVAGEGKNTLSNGVPVLEAKEPPARLDTTEPMALLYTNEAGIRVFSYHNKTRDGEDYYLRLSSRRSPLDPNAPPEESRLLAAIQEFIINPEDPSKSQVIDYSIYHDGSVRSAGLNGEGIVASTEDIEYEKSFVQTQLTKELLGSLE